MFVILLVVIADTSIDLNLGMGSYLLRSHSWQGLRWEEEANSQLISIISLRWRKNWLILLTYLWIFHVASPLVPFCLLFANWGTFSAWALFTPHGTQTPWCWPCMPQPTPSNPGYPTSGRNQTQDRMPLPHILAFAKYLVFSIKYNI